MTAFYIGIAGGLGSLSRFLLGSWAHRVWANKLTLPAGTLTVNVVGALLMGLLVGVVSTRGELDERWRMVLGVGFLGGFTTYSSFALETVGLLEERSSTAAFAYVLLTLVSAGLACFVGLMLGRRF